MTTISSERIPLASLKPLDMSELSIHKLNPKEMAEFNWQMKQILESEYTRPVGPTGYGDYAKIVVDGKTVATLSNEGFAQMSNALGAQLGGQLENQGEGPELAEKRARQIANALGGDIVKLPSAMNQSGWNARHPLQTAVDFAAMARDGRLEQWQKLAGTDSLFAAQQIGQNR